MIALSNAIEFLHQLLGDVHVVINGTSVEGEFGKELYRDLNSRTNELKTVSLSAFLESTYSAAVGAALLAQMRN